MAYGDKIHFYRIKDCRLFYEKPRKNDYPQNWITFQIINKDNWVDTLQFDDRKEWFKFVRKVNRANKIIKAKNIEKEMLED